MNLIGKPTINPVLFFSGKLIGYLIWLIFGLALFQIKYINISNNEVTRYISYFLLFSGLLISIMSMINLGNSTRLGLPEEKTVFKKSGLYQLSRNPMYIGFNLITLASVIYSGNLIVVSFGIYSISIYHAIILGEEKYLINQYGDDYQEYKKRVRRYI
jgi:protein-S-isoprenylcysteine O-methyltransferase Ste14